jgi:pimeloyl-ACP methyl ester carboxylesterase
MLPPVYSDEELQRIQTPMLLLIGDYEVIYNPERVIRRATKWVAGLHAEIIPNANHNAQVTAADVVNERIIDFLAS